MHTHRDTMSLYTRTDDIHTEMHVTFIHTEILQVCTHTHARMHARTHTPFYCIYAQSFQRDWWQRGIGAEARAFIISSKSIIMYYKNIIDNYMIIDKRTGRRPGSLGSRRAPPNRGRGSPDICIYIYILAWRDREMNTMNG
jgi:hypothetical protein